MMEGTSWKLQDMSAEDSTAHIYDYLYHRTHFARCMYRNFAKTINRHTKGGRILELGCGVAYLSGILSADTTLDRYCMDFAYNMLKKAKTRCSQCVQADMEYLPYSDKSFDAVFVSSALHHFPYLENVVKETQRILKPNGHLFIQEPNDHHLHFTKPLAIMHECLRKLSVRQYPDVSKLEVKPSEHHAPLPVDMVVASLQNNGFSIVNQKYLYYSSYLFSVFDNRLVHWLSRIPDKYYVNKLHDGYLFMIIGRRQ